MKIKNDAIISVSEMLSPNSLKYVVIPPYQRPYKWTQKNIMALFQDLQTHQDKSAYRLGSVVFHQQSTVDDSAIAPLDIVDGQQRTLTLLLAVWALIHQRMDTLARQDLKTILADLKGGIDEFMQRQQFASDISQFNLQQNYLEMTRLVSRPDFTEAHIDFLLHKCQMVVFILHDVSEAFQFFDSQNARGRDLEPHDLLKAFHLREFATHESSLKAQAVAHWENLPSNDLATLFATYLYRIRHWAKGKSARYFDKNQVALFKGVNLDRVGDFPYAESLRITHHFVDEYNGQYQRKIDQQQQQFPFHLDQMIINGRRFFELSEHYQQRIAHIAYNNKTHDQLPALIKAAKHENTLSTLASKIMTTLHSYPKRHRTGDRYVRMMFDCALIFYTDRFGSQSLSQAIEKLFIWAYRCRIQQHAVHLATVDNHVLDHNVFDLMKEAIQPTDFLIMPLSSVQHAKNKNNKDPNAASKDELVMLFKEMNYYE